MPDMEKRPPTPVNVPPPQPTTEEPTKRRRPVEEVAPVPVPSPRKEPTEGYL
jgi:hypothetical protein